MKELAHGCGAGRVCSRDWNPDMPLHVRLVIKKVCRIKYSKESQIILKSMNAYRVRLFFKGKNS